MIQFKINKEVKNINGWAFTTKTGIYGTDYLMRALVTAIGLGANRPQDAVYPTSQKDADDRTYDGANKYVMRFPKGQTAAGRRLLVADDVRRQLLLRRQSDQPLLDQRRGRTSKRIRTARSTSTSRRILRARTRNRTGCRRRPGKFILMLRMYWPNESTPSIINGSWTIPPVKKVS